MTYILIRPLKAFFPLIYNFLPYAEGTARLRKDVLKLELMLMHNLPHYALNKYLTVIQKLVSKSNTWIMIHMLNVADGVA